MSRVRAREEEVSTPKKARTGAEQDARSNAEKHSQAYVRPADWPVAGGEIDLAVQDLPHESANTEWWYVNNHVQTADGRQFSLFASFFRIHANKKHAHAISAGIVDVQNKRYYSMPLVDPSAPKMLKWQIENGVYDLDSRLSRALLEVVKKGTVPLPDRLLPGEAKIATDALNLDYAGGNTFVKQADGSYRVTVNLPEEQLAFDITLSPRKKVIKQGHDGVVQVGIKQETMYYYFIPRNAVVGTISLKGETFNVSGNGWYDHEFGGGIRDGVYDAPEESKGGVTAPAAEASSSSAMTDGDAAASNGASSSAAAAAAAGPATPAKKATRVSTSSGAKTPAHSPVKKESEKDNSYAWDWFSMQLEDGTDITATNLVDPVKKIIYDRFCVIIGADSARAEHHDLELTSENPWISVRSSSTYPLDWHLTSKSAQMDLRVKAVFPQQEIVTLISKPAFWEGRMDISGTIAGKPVKGTGFLERHGFEEIDSLDKFFKRMSKVVLAEIDAVLPYHPTYEQARDLLATAEYDHMMRGVDINVMSSTVLKPLREIIDRGGKTWRSYALILCIDCVGGTSFDYQRWLAMPEIMHVGSLIVDDIQDNSQTRRGGPTCHAVYGNSIAINAGTAAYFLAMDILQQRTTDITDAVRLKLFNLYVLTLRAGHFGQAFDINGQDAMMEEVCKGKVEPQRLVDSVIATHRLKSAVPAGNLARMGAIFGRGTEAQSEAVGRYFESIGIAFQIIDDVLNLRGFEGNVKRRGEDIAMGKITFPVAFATTLLPLEKRAGMWASIKSKPDDDAVILSVIEDLERVDAINKSVEIATAMVDEAWLDMDKHIPDSFYKLMLRAFGWYVLERHY